MNSTDEIVKPRFWDSTRVICALIIPIVLITIVVIGLISQSPVVSTPSKEPSWSTTIKSEYGAEKVSFIKGFFYITIDGKTQVCKVISDKELAARTPIECSNNITIEAK